MPINKATSSGASGDAIGSITPQNSGDALLAGISPWETGGSGPSPWTHYQSGSYYLLPGSTSPVTLDVPAPLSPNSEWAMMILDIPTTGSAAYVTAGNLDFGVYPESQYTHTFTASSGDALIISLCSDSVDTYGVSCSDTQGNTYEVYQFAQNVGGLIRGVLFAVAYGVAAGSVTTTVNITGQQAVGGQDFVLNYSQFSGFVAPPPPIPPLQTVVLGFQDPAGNPLAFGSVVLRLQQDISAAFVGGPQVSAGRTIKIPLDQNGEATFEIWPAGSLTPATKYFATAYSAQGQPAWKGELTVVTS